MSIALKLNLNKLTVEDKDNDRRAVAILMDIGMMSLLSLHVKVDDFVSVGLVNVECCFGMNFSRLLVFNNFSQILRNR